MVLLGAAAVGCGGSAAGRGGGSGGNAGGGDDGRGTGGGEGDAAAARAPADAVPVRHHVLAPFASCDDVTGNEAMIADTPLLSARDQELSGTYRVQGRQVYNGGSLTIAPGTTFVMEADVAIHFTWSCATGSAGTKVTMAGTQDAPIRFCPSADRKGHWKTLAFRCPAEGSEMAWVHVEGGGGRDQSTALTLGNGLPLRHVEVLRSKHLGVSADAFAPGSGPLLVAEGDGRPLRLGAGAISTLPPGDYQRNREPVAEVGQFAGSQVVFHDRGFVVARDWQSVLAWDPDSGELLLEVEEPDDQSGSLAVDPAGRSIATGTEEGKVRIRDLETGAIVETFEIGNAAVTALAYSSDGSVLACGTADRSIALWLTEERTLAHRLGGHENRVTALAFSPDDSRLVSGSVDNTVRIWNPATGEALLALRGHESEVTAVLFSPDGAQIASASKDGTVRLWRAAPPTRQY